MPSALPAGTGHQPQELVTISSGASRRIRMTILLPLALMFAFATVTYTAIWMYYIHIRQRVELGFVGQGGPSNNDLEITDIQKDSPAEQAGLRLHDRILAVNGKKLGPQDVADLSVAPEWTHARPGDAVVLMIQRPGVAAPFSVRAQFRAFGPEEPLVRRVAEQIMSVYPVFFLIVGLAVLFVRLDDQSAWLLALLFAAFIAASDQPKSFASLPRELHSFTLAYRAIFLSLIAPLFYFFFAVFPVCSGINRRFPRLKWVLVALGISFAIAGFSAGRPQPWPIMKTIMGPRLAEWTVLSFLYSIVFVGLASLTSNVVQAPSADARRKLKIVLWGTAVGVVPVVVVHAAIDFFHLQGIPFWLDFSTVVLLWVFPLSFAYAVVKHRVLEIPVLLKRSARYVFVRRGLAVFIVLLAACLIALFTVAFSLFFPIGSKAAMATGVVFGIALASVSTPGLKRVTNRIDRAFFRGAYDARIILQELAQRAPRFNTRKDLAEEVASRVDEALHPTWLAVYVEAAPDFLEAEAARLAAPLERIRKDSPLLEHLDRSGEPWDAYLDPGLTAALPAIFAPLQPECLVAFPSRSGELLGLLVLGSRLSEEPYSGEDKILLRSVSSQAGVALDNRRLAEEIAERLEAERNALREMEIARQVQSKLLPQTVPQLKTLEIAGTCSQARAVGGDYYDFVELGPGRLALVLADVAGKGISAALLMANLQANLRSQYGIALEDQPRLLQRVNRLFYENTEPNHYTTMFFACYDDDSKRLVYANCGHNPPLLLRKNGGVEHLDATATVLGMFPEWQCEVRQVQLGLGDILAVYSDGVTEAMNERDEEFGELRLQQALQSDTNLSAADLLARVLHDVRAFSAGKQSDDITIIIGRAK